MSILAVDPLHGDAHFTSPTDYNTRYRISMDDDDENGHITIAANGELTDDISVSR